MNAPEQSAAKLETWMSLQRKYKKMDAAQMAFFRDLQVAVLYLREYGDSLRKNSQQS
jgi:hypothetical protein